MRDKSDAKMFSSTFANLFVEAMLVFREKNYVLNCSFTSIFLEYNIMARSRFRNRIQLLVRARTS